MSMSERIAQAIENTQKLGLLSSFTENDATPCAGAEQSPRVGSVDRLLPFAAAIEGGGFRAFSPPLPPSAKCSPPPLRQELDLAILATVGSGGFRQVGVWGC